MAVFTGTSDFVALKVRGRMKQSLDRFTKQVDQFTKNRVPREVVTIHKKITIDALSAIVLKMPVRTGHARRNWNVAIGAPDDTVRPTPENAAPEPASVTIQRGTAQAAGIRPFETMHISNNVHYMIWLENGSSKQAPQGVVAITVEELRQMFPG